MSLTTEKYLQPTDQQKAALFELRRRMRVDVGKFKPQQVEAEKILSARWGISEAESGSPFDQPQPPAGFVSPKPPSKLETFGKEALAGLAELTPGGQLFSKFYLPVATQLAGKFVELPERAKKIAEFADKPLAPLRKLVDTVLPAQENIPDVPVFLPVAGGKAVSLRTQAGIVRGLAGLTQDFTTPKNFAILAATSGASAVPMLARYGLPAVEAFFAYEAARAVPELWKAYQDAPDAEKPELMTQIVGSIGIGAMAAKGAAKKIGEGVKIAKQRPKALPELEEAARVTTEISEAAAKRKAAEPVTVQELQQKAQTDLAALSERESTRLHPEDAKSLAFLRSNINKTPALERAYHTRVEPPETVQKFRQEKEAKRAESEQRIIEQKAQAEQARIGQERAAKKIEDEQQANLETSDLQIGSIAERLAGEESNVPLVDLAVTEKNRVRARASKEYADRLRTISRELELTDEALAGPKNRKARLKQARATLRQQLVDEKNTRQVTPTAEIPVVAPEAPVAERGLERRPVELAPEDIEIMPPRPPVGLPASEDVYRSRLTTPVKGELPGVTETTTPAVEARRGEYVGEIPETRIPSASRAQERRTVTEQPAPGTKTSVAAQEPAAPKTPEPTLAERKEQSAKVRQDLIERKLEFAKQQQADKERLVAEKRTGQEQKRREALAAKLEASGKFSKVTVEKERPKAEEVKKVEKAPVIAETSPTTGGRSGQPPTGQVAATEGRQKPVAARPTAARLAPVKPEVENLRPAKQLKMAEKIANDIDQSKEGWQDELKAKLEQVGLPDQMVRFVTEQTRRTRPTEPFGVHTATTREGRAENATAPPPELAPKVNAIADIARKNQIAQARADAAQKELARNIEKEGKGGVQVSFDPQGGYEITITNPDVLTASVKKEIAIIKNRAVLENKIAVTPDVKFGLGIHATPVSEVLKGTELSKGTFTEKVLETLRRKQEAANTQKAFDKVKQAYKDDLVDAYFKNNEQASFTGKTKEGLPVTIGVRHSPAGRTILAEDVRQAIANKEAVDRGHIDTGIKLFDSAKSRGEWDDKMVAQYGTEIKSKLDDIWNASKEYQDNKYAAIGNVGKKIINETTAESKGFAFIRANLSKEDLAEFDGNLDKIKATDISMFDKANNFAQVLAAQAKQYGNYAEFGYYTLKALANKTGEVVVNKAAWAAEMVKHLGDEIRPFIDDLWKKINTESYKPGQVFAEADLPKFNANTVRPRVERIKESLPDDKPLETVQNAKRPAPFIGAYVEPVIRTIERISPKVATGFRQAIDHWENKEGAGNALINPLARELRFSPMALSRLDAISRTDGASSWDNWHEWLAKPGTRPADLTKVESEAVGVYNKLLQGRVKVLTEAGRKNVKDILFKRVPSFDMLDAIRSENGAVYNTLVKELARLNDMPIEKVQGYLKNYRLDKFEQFPTHLRVGKGKFADTVPVLATQGLSALRALNRDTSRLAGVTKRFGDNYSQTFKDIRKGLPANFQADFDLARDAYFGVRRLENSRSLSKRLLLNLAQPVVRTALLARSFVQQPTQALAATRFTTGATFLRGLSDLAKKGTKAELEAIGAYAPGILDLAWQKGQRIEDLGRILSEFGGNVSLLKPAIEMTDLGITAGFRRFALDIKERGGKLKPREKNTLEVLNFSPEQINLIDKHGLAGYKDADVLYSAVINRGRKAVTFTGLKGPERTKFQLNPLISSLIQFQGFNIGQMQQAAGVVKNLSARVDALKAAQTPDEKRAARAQLGSAAKQALILFGATMTASEANILMKSLINGQDPNRPEDWKRVFEDLVETGWVPFLREFSYGFGGDPGKVVLPLGILDDLTDAHAGRHRYKDYEGWERAAMFLDRYAAKPYSQAYNTPKNVLIATGLAEGNPTLKTATNYYWDFLKNNNAFKASEREGYNETQAAMREIVNAVKNSEYGAFSNETRAKIREGVAKAIKAKGLELVQQGKDPADAMEEAQKRVRQGLLARQTLSKFYQEDEGYWKIGNKKFNRKQLDDTMRGGKYTTALLTYDRLLNELADSL